ncbi:MAG: hypothetical protein JWQ55_6684 [Rhodopila sp.]|jgi:hypothetical protein|nr:hypothetical protein [Rhodopila sp.]
MAAAASSETTNMSQSMVTRDAVDKRTPSLPASAGDHPTNSTTRDNRMFAEFRRNRATIDTVRTRLRRLMPHYVEPPCANSQFQTFGRV